MRTGIWLTSCPWVQDSSPFVNVIWPAYFPHLFSIAMINTTSKSNLGRKILFHPTTYSASEGKLGTNSPQESGGKNWSRDHGGGMLLIDSTCLAQLPFLDYPGPQAQGWHHLQCTGPSYINYENTLKIFLQENLMEAFFFFAIESNLFRCICHKSK